VLSLPLLAYMRAPRTKPGAVGRFDGDGIGLPWLLWNNAGQRFAAIQGETLDRQFATLLIYPERMFALALFGNSSSGRAMIDDVIEWSLGQLFAMTNPVSLLDLPADELAAYAGRYAVEVTPNRTLAVRQHEIAVRDGALIDRASDGSTTRLRFYRKDGVIALDGPRAGQRGDFLRDAAGTVGWFREGLRAVPRAR
jgi:hypothetical protein